MPDKAHAGDGKGRASANASPATAKRIDAKADKKLSGHAAAVKRMMK